MIKIIPYFLACIGVFFATPQFKDHPVNFEVIQGEKLEFKFFDLLSDQGSGNLAFLALDPPPTWLVLDSVKKEAAGVPPLPGKFEFRFSVKELEVDVGDITKIIITVHPKEKPPVWLENPISFQTKSNKVFSKDISQKAIDPEGLPLKFSRKSDGPAWLTLTEAGLLGGTPKNSDLDENRFSLIVTDAAGLTAETSLIIQVVKPPEQIDSFNVDSVFPLSRTEILWASDHSTGSRLLIHLIKMHISHFYNELKRLKVNHVGLYLSSDSYWHPNPIPSLDGRLLMRWNDFDLAGDFRARADKGWVIESVASAIWSIDKFFQKAPTLPIFQKGFFEPDVPFEVMILTEQQDEYKWWERYTKSPKKEARDYGDRFKNFLLATNKKLTVTGIGPEVPPVGQTWPPENVPEILSLQSGGKFYKTHHEIDFPKTLREYAVDIAARAPRVPKEKIKLSKTPLVPSQISVSIENVVIAPPIWSYDSVKNELIIDWDQIDLSQFPSGAALKVQYEYDDGLKYY